MECSFTNIRANILRIIRLRVQHFRVLFLYKLEHSFQTYSSVPLKEDILKVCAFVSKMLRNSALENRFS